LTLAIFVLTFVACRALVLHAPYMFQVALPFWIAGIAASRDLRTAGARVLCGILVLAGIVATGTLNYLYALGSYTVTAFFYNEGRGLPPSGETGPYDVLLQVREFYDVVMYCAPFAVAGLFGAGLILQPGSSWRPRVFAVAYISSIGL